MVSNPDGQSGTLLRGFTYESEAASLSLPDTSGGQYAIVQLPINLANVSGLTAAEVTVVFNSSVLTARRATTGSLTSGWMLEANTGTPGSIRLAMASTAGSVSGSGVLANIEFEVTGAPGSQTALTVAAVSLNDGAIPVTAANGSFTVHRVYSVSGAVRFWNGAAPVPGTLLTLTGNSVHMGASNAEGLYSVTGAPAGNYVMTPSKSADIRGIGAFDASLALQHAVGSATLVGQPAIAADVDSSGTVTAMDAFYILQHAANLITPPFPGSGMVWRFQPGKRSYSDLSSDLTEQNYTAILLGDVSGNWPSEQDGSGQVYGAGEGSPMAPGTTVSPEGLAASVKTPMIRLKVGNPAADGTVLAEVHLDPNGTQVFSVTLDLQYDNTRAVPVSADLGPATQNWLKAQNFNVAGKVRAALAGAAPVIQRGHLLTLKFQLSSPAGNLSLTPDKGEINEGVKASFGGDISSIINLLLTDK
jgi:hypothetical protein